MITKQAEDLLEKSALLWQGVNALGKGLMRMGRAASTAAPNGKYLPAIGNKLQQFGKNTRSFAVKDMGQVERSVKNYASSNLSRLKGKITNPLTGGQRPPAAPTPGSAPGSIPNPATAAKSKIPGFIRNNKLAVGTGALGLAGGITGTRATMRNSAGIAPDQVDPANMSA